MSNVEGYYSQNNGQQARSFRGKNAAVSCSYPAAEGDPVYPVFLFFEIK
jgi:hypothetical protein